MTISTEERVFDSQGGTWSIVLWGGLIISLIIIILYVIPQLLRGLRQSSLHKEPLNNQSKFQILVYCIIILLAAYFTWSNMLNMAYEDFTTSGYNSINIHNILEWLVTKKAHRSQSLFFEAYYNVVNNSIKYCYSSTVLSFVLTFIIFLVDASQLYNIPKLYLFTIIWIGFACAISVAITLFFIIVTLFNHYKSKTELERNINKSIPVSLELLISLFLSALTLWTIPITTGFLFKLSILLGHFILLIPLVTLKTSNQLDNSTNNKHSINTSGFLFNISQLYIFISGFAFCFQIFTWQSLLIEVQSHYNLSLEFSLSYLYSLIDIIMKQLFYSHLAQASITWDFVFTTISITVFMLFNNSSQSNRTIIIIISLFMLLNLISVSVIFPLYLAVFYRYNLIKQKTE